MKPKALIVLALALLITACSTNLSLSDKQARHLSESVCLIAVVTPDSDTYSYGTGWVARNARNDIRIYTAGHVLEEALAGEKIIYVGFWDTEKMEVVYHYIAEVAGYEADPVDLGSVKITEELSENSLRKRNPISQSEVNNRFKSIALEFDLARKPKNMEYLFVVGFPSKGLWGEFLQYHRAEVSGYTTEGYIILNTTGSLDEGISGGPVFDSRGKTVVGVAIASTKNPDTGQRANLAVPSTYLDRIYNDEEGMLASYNKPQAPATEEAQGEPVILNVENLNILEVTNNTGQDLDRLFIFPYDTTQLGADALGDGEYFDSGAKLSFPISYPNSSNNFRILAHSRENDKYYLVKNLEVQDGEKRTISLSRTHRIKDNDEIPDEFTIPTLITDLTIKNGLDLPIKLVFISPAESSMYGIDVLGSNWIPVKGTHKYQLFNYIESGEPVRYEIVAIDKEHRIYSGVINLEADSSVLSYEIKPESMVRK